jgi:hypothetical protein
MKFHPPKGNTWLISVLLGLAGVLLHEGILRIGGLAGYSFWIVVAGLGLLILATLFRSL